MKEHQEEDESTIKKTLQAIMNEPTAVQQAVVNCLDSFNVDLQKKGIPKQYRIDVRLFNAAKNIIIGASKKKEYTMELKYVLINLDSNGKQKNEGILYSCTTRIENAKEDGTFPKGSAVKAVDQCFLVLMRESLGLYALAAEQRAQRETAGHANG